MRYLSVVPRWWNNFFLFTRFLLFQCSTFDRLRTVRECWHKPLCMCVWQRKKNTHRNAQSTHLYNPPLKQILMILSPFFSVFFFLKCVVVSFFTQLHKAAKLVGSYSESRYKINLRTINAIVQFLCWSHKLQKKLSYQAQRSQAAHSPHLKTFMQIGITVYFFRRSPGAETVFGGNA